MKIKFDQANLGPWEIYRQNDWVYFDSLNEGIGFDLDKEEARKLAEWLLLQVANMEREILDAS